MGMLEAAELAASAENVSPYVLGIREELKSGSLRPLAKFPLGDIRLELVEGRDSVWALFLREGTGGLAVRTAFIPGGGLACTLLDPAKDEVARVRVRSAVGEHTVVLHKLDVGSQRVRLTVKLTPLAPLAVPFAPRDVYPFDASFDPLGVEGEVEAAQRGLNGGLVYFRVTEPDFGSVLYLQNLTALNSYFRATKTKPDGAVGGEWPELGYLVPTKSKDGEQHPLAAGEDVIVSDAIPRHQARTDAGRGGRRTAFSADVGGCLYGAGASPHRFPGPGGPCGAHVDGPRHFAQGHAEEVRRRLCASLHRCRISRQHGADVAAQRHA